jgi:hypothetical protein
MTLFKHEDYELDMNKSSKAFVYYKDQLLFMGDSRTAIKLFCKNCTDPDLRAKLKKYKYINIWD